MNISEPYYDARQARTRRWAITVYARSSGNAEVLRYESEQAARDAREQLVERYESMATTSARVRLDLDRERERANA